MLKRMISLILCMAMVVSMLPMQAMAFENVGEAETIAEHGEESAEFTEVETEHLEETESTEETDSSEVTVFEEMTVSAVESVMISGVEEQAELIVGNTVQLTATVLPENVADKTVVWDSSDEAIANVDENGCVTALSAGDVTIIAACQGVEASYLLKIIARETAIESQTIENKVAASAAYGDGWGNWSDYVVESSVVVYPVENGNLYFGHESYMSQEEVETEIYLLGADSTVTKAEIPAHVDGLKVSKINTYAFGACLSLSYVWIPNTVLSIGDTVFPQNDKLQEILVEEGSAHYFSEDGVLYACYNTTIKTLIKYPSHKTGEVYVVPSGTTRIDPYAFGGISFCKTLYLPVSIDYIERNAFSKYSSLLQINYAGTSSQFQAIQGYENANVPGMSIQYNMPVPSGEPVEADYLLTGSITERVIGITDKSVLKSDYYEFVEREGYSEFLTAIADGFEIEYLSFALKDLNLDGNDELVIAAQNNINWWHCLIFSKQSEQIDFWGAVYTYTDIAYSSEQNAISYVMTNDYNRGTFRIDETGITLCGEYDDTYQELRWMSQDDILAYLSDTGLMGWQKAYYDFIVADKAQKDFDWKYVTYELAYLNDDAIPELWIDYSYTFAGGRIMSYFNEQLVTSTLALGTLTYEKKENAFYHSWGHMGIFSDTVYRLTDEGLIKVAEGTYSMYDENGVITSNVTSWNWGGLDVSEEWHYKYLNDWVDPETAIVTGSQDGEIYDYDGILEYLLSAESEEPIKEENGLVIFSDYTSLSIDIGSVLTLSAGILVDGSRKDDVSGITLQIVDTSVLELEGTGTSNKTRFFELKGKKEGCTSVVISDSLTGYKAKISISVYKNNFHSYSLNNIPIKYIEKYPTNFYNYDGLFIDNYAYSVNADKTANVTFDVYNTNYAYGAVEIFDENGNLEDAVLIKKCLQTPRV